MPELYLTPAIEAVLAAPGTVAVGSLSGGKDSTVYLDRLKRTCPALDVRLVFADTGAEYQEDPDGRWPSTLNWCIQLAAHYGYPLTVVRNPRRTLKQEIRERRRFPAPATRWCSTHHKRNQIWKYIRTIDAEHIVSIQGHRADESDFRRGMPPWEIIPDLCARRARTTGRPRTVWNWLPIHHWGLHDVLDYVAEQGIELHPIYRFLDRLSCEVCIYHGPRHFSATRKNNRRAFDEYNRLERELGFTVSMRRRYMDELADEYDAGSQWIPPTATYAKGYDCGYW